MPSSFHPSEMSLEAFAMLGAERVAYVCALRSEDVGFVHAEAPLLPPGRWVFVLTAADGRPLLIAESPEALAQEAAGCDMDTVSVH
jgi:hypothetical protein